MTRTAFLAALEQLLAPLPEAERKDALSYYEDYLDAAGPENEARAIAQRQMCIRDSRGGRSQNSG